jgi:hypothetical protein
MEGWKQSGINESSGETFISILDQDYGLVADVWLQHEDFRKLDPEQGKRNATLIAAAPELLEAAKEVFRLLEGQEGLSSPLTTALKAMDAAIVKAEGGDGQ